MSPRPLEPSIVSRQRLITAFDVSVDANTIVFAQREVRDQAYVSHLWVVEADGGHPSRLTTSAVSDTAPHVSPDGSQVAFVSDRGGGKAQPWTMPLGGGEPSKVCDLPDGASSVAWSPDGSTLLVIGSSGEERFLIGTRKDDPIGRVIRDVHWRYDGTGVLDQLDDAWTVAAAGGKPVRRTGPSEGAASADWSPNGQDIVYLADRGPESGIAHRPQVWSIPSGGGRPIRVSPEGQVAIQTAWGAGGIAWTGWEARVPAWQTIGAWVRRGPSVIRLAEGRDLFVEPVGYSELSSADRPTLAWLDEDHLAVIASERGLSHPWRLGLDGSAVCLTPDASTGCVLLRTAGGRIFVVASLDGMPSDLFEAEDGRLRKIAKGGNRWFGPFRRSAERITLRRRSLPDVDAFLLRAEARGARPRPLIVRIHGGPFDAFGPTSRFEDVMLAGAGYHLLRPNPRGSVSYGEDFARAIDGRWGVPDGDDIMAMIDRLTRDGVVDPDRVGLLGLSYGGFMVHHLLGRFPGRFKAAVSENPFTTVLADYGAGDSADEIVEGMGLGPWPEAAADWLQASTVLTITRNEAPLLLLVAEADLRCPPIHSEIAFTALRMAGKPAEMVRYPGEYHVMYVDGRPDRRIDRLERILTWFGRHL
jgi:dipeptidyl aminopeptidase/acylaminoacyl peptidase